MHEPAISEHQRQTDHIRLLQSHYNTAAAEVDIMRRELQGLRMENAALREGNHAGAAPPPPPPAAPQFSDPFPSSARTELPPLRSLGGAMSGGPESMTGVQYDPPRVNGYRDGGRF